MSSTPNNNIIGIQHADNPGIISGPAARMAYGSAALALILIVSLHFLKHDLAPHSHMLSEYAIGEYGWVMKLSFFSWAASCFAVAIVVAQQVTVKRGKTGILLIILSGISLLAGGIFEIDSPYAEIAQSTMHGSIHGLSAMIGLPGQAIAGLLISYDLKRNREWKPEIKPLIVLAHLAWVMLLLTFASTFIMMAKSGGKFNGDTAIGWFNRLTVLVYCGWLMMAGVTAMRLNKNKP